MILHISCDDQFVRYVDKQFMDDSLSSRLIVCDYKSTPSRAKNAPHMEYIQVRSKEFESLKESLGKFNGVIFHGLFGAWSTELLDAVPSHVKIGWVCWDAEVFSRYEEELKYQKPLTRIIRRIKRIFSFFKNKCKVKTAYFVPKKYFGKIEYCLCDMPQEAEAANKCFSTQLKWLPYNYYSINETIGELRNKRIEGRCVFLGNCCTYNNNHIDAFLHIHPLIKDRFVITPLSYGDMGLLKYVLFFGRLLLGNNFVPITQYLSLDEYNSMMLSCSVMIMNHGSPAAQGNIITGLWLGMRVYLNKNSITYKFFKSLGVHIFSIEDDLNKRNPNALASLSEDEIIHNQSILDAYYGDSVTKERVINILKYLNNENDI